MCVEWDWKCVRGGGGRGLRFRIGDGARKLCKAKLSQRTRRNLLHVKVGLQVPRQARRLVARSKGKRCLTELNCSESS